MIFSKFPKISILKFMLLASFVTISLVLLTIEASADGLSDANISAQGTPDGFTQPNMPTVNNPESSYQPSTCQQQCYENYKKASDICYATSVGSEDLNRCIMEQREIFKNCSKAC